MNATSPPERCAPPHSRFADACVLAATVSGSSIAIIDATAVNVALPAIQRGFDADIAALQWVVESYALFLAALILVGGVLGDHLGRKRLFAIGVIAFAAASAWCGLAPDIEQLIVARAVQGVGAALVVPGSLALLSAHFPTARRGRAIGQWASFTTLAIALGPVLGGVLVDVASWRWVFFINLPIAAFLLAVLYAGVPESRDESAARKLDIAGAVLITLGLGGLVFGLLESSRLGFASAMVWGPMVAGLVIIIIFILRQWTAASPMLPLALFRSRAFSGANVMTFLLYGAMSGSLFFLPFNLMQVQGWSATEAGAALLPLILAIAFFSLGAARLVARFGQRPPLVVGAGVAALGFALLALPGAGSAYWAGFFPGLAVVGLGLGIAVAPLTIVVMAAVPANRAGLASGVNNSASRVAMLMAVALFGVVMFEIYSGHLRAALDSLPLDGASRAVIEAHMSDLAGLQAPPGLDAGTAARLHTAVGESFVAGFRAVAVISAAVALLGAIIAALTISPRAINE
ncbi:MAG: MFS transporter [Alphaproteobacteria bacterium]|nr:MFS transporter [Alphaproteobacteria bacterium]MDP6589866.1 MFS transporter [Alphaproteobacteria bacterium]MDP6819352.1 MFS transporter [Alphaproteobacteria bacterium]